MQDRELSSAPELFTDAAMRNALRKIAALQAKPQPRSRASSARTSALNSALNSSRVSSEGDAVCDAAAAAASRDGSPGGFDAAHSRFMQVRAAHLTAAVIAVKASMVHASTGAGHGAVLNSFKDHFMAIRVSKCIAWD